MFFQTSCSYISRSFIAVSAKHLIRYLRFEVLTAVKVPMATVRYSDTLISTYNSTWPYNLEGHHRPLVHVK